MKFITLSILSACPCLAVISNFRVAGTTATQALIAYTAPNGSACTVAVSQSAGLTPLALDVDPNTFANSNSDLSRPSTVAAGLSRTVVVGQRTAQYATAGPYSGLRHFSRALQADTPYFGQITCPSTGDILPFTFTTGNIPLGQTYGDPWLQDPTHPGDQPWPESLGGLTPESFIDPLTGTLQYRVGLRGNMPTIWNLPFGSAFNQGQVTPCDSAGPWTTPCAIVSGGGGGQTTIGNSAAVLVLRSQMTGGGPWNTSYGNFFSLDQISLSLTGSSSAATEVLNICLSMNGGISCASPAKQLPPLTTASSTVTGGGSAPTAYYNPLSFGADEWVVDTNPRFNLPEASPHSGTGTVSGTTLTNSIPPTGDLFSLYWAGGTIRISTVSTTDACTTPPNTNSSVEYRIASFIDGYNLTVTGTPPQGAVYWCEDNFAIMLWRATPDSNTIALSNAVLNLSGSPFPSYPDNGAGLDCFDTLSYGGWFCLYGPLFWVNPSGPEVVYYGMPQGAGVNASGSPIANSWSQVTAPTGESASIDQTQSNLTFYMVGEDPAGGGPLVIQGGFNPGSAPVQTTAPQSPAGIPQIGNATVTSTTAYSVTWSNGVTFTNLTPQSTMSESVFDQAEAFDPTFNSSYYSNHNCNLAGAASQGNFIFACYSQGGDSPAWVFVFSPGNRNPANAGSAGGPQIIGMMNTFNTPQGPVSIGQGAMTGRSLHAFGATGETGWFAIGGNIYQPINTSTANIPASGPEPCTFYGLTGNTNDCILIQISSYTHANVTGYEPYFASPTSPFTGAPGELRTTQIGDTACVTTTSAGWCNAMGGATELWTLRIKNYGGTQGAWVFQRNTYGAELAVTGPIALWWSSYQSLIPPGSVNQGTAVQVYWSPTSGCGGSPDPHGSCLLMDPNETNAHNEQQAGGVSQASSPPTWSQPFWGWPFAYQTEIGSIPATLSLPFANQTPNQAGGVNYVAEEPPFAGVFGHPWGDDAGSHSNGPGTNASSYERLRAFDNLPVGAGQNEPTFTAVAGQAQLYCATPTSNIDADDIFGYQGPGAGCNTGTAGNGCVAINRKLMATGVSCGSHPVIDVSGPSSAILSGIAGSYTYCIVRVNGECESGSTVGQIYVNCPGVLAVGGAAGCGGSTVHGGTPLGVGNDICVGNIGNGANAIIQYSLNQTDYTGATRRAVVNATARLRMVYDFENNQLLPDNSWILYRQEWLNYQRPEMWMAMNLPYPPDDPGDSVARGTFVPMTVSLNPPAGLAVNNAIIEFGYQEYGAPQQLNCTTRNDACIATTNSVTPGNQPFNLASQNLPGAPCTSGCTIAIPAISQRILYYQVQYRAANNAVLAADPPAAVVVP